MSLEQAVERRRVVVPAGDQEARERAGAGSGLARAGGPRRCACARPSQLLDADVLELDQARRAGPGTRLVLGAVVLQRDLATRGQIGNGGARNDGLAVQDHRDGLAAHRDLEMVPLADRLVGAGARSDGRAHLGRRLGIGAQAVHFARPDRPAPDIDLKPSVAPQVDPGIGIGKRHPHLLAADVRRMRSIRQDVWDVLVEKRRLLEPPIELEHEVAILAVAPQRLVALRFTRGIVVDRVVDDLPVSVIAGGHLPAREALAVEQRDESVARTIVGGANQRGEQQSGDGNHQGLPHFHGRAPCGV